MSPVVSGGGLPVGMGDGLDAGVVAAGEMRADALPTKHEFRIKIGERAQDEGSRANAGMRQGKARVVKVQVVIGEQVEVKGARRVFEGAFAALLVFNCLQEVKQRQRRKVATVADDGVDEIGLRSIAPGRRAIEARSTGFREVPSEGLARAQQLGDRVILVAAVGDPEGVHGMAGGFRNLYIHHERSGVCK